MGYGLLRYRNDFICYRYVLDYTGENNMYGKKSYREFVEEGLLTGTDSPFDDIKGHVVLGEPAPLNSFLYLPISGFT